jgi:hypothetical protein
MRIEFPSREFDDAAAAACHDLVSDELGVGLDDGEHLRRRPGAQGLDVGTDGPEVDPRLGVPARG